MSDLEELVILVVGLAIVFPVLGLLWIGLNMAFGWPLSSVTSARVWTEAEADPEFNAAIERGEEDIAAGRVMSFQELRKVAHGAMERRSIDAAIAEDRRNVMVTRLSIGAYERELEKPSHVAGEYGPPTADEVFAIKHFGLGPDTLAAIDALIEMRHSRDRWASLAFLLGAIFGLAVYALVDALR